MVRASIRNQIKPGRAFSEKTLEALKNIQKEYTEGFLPLFEKLSKIQPTVADKKAFLNLQESGFKIASIIDKLIDSQGNPLANDIEDLFLHLDFIDNQLLTFKERLDEDNNLSEDFEKASKETKDSLEDILKTQKSFRRSRGRGIKGKFGVGGIFKEVLSGVSAGIFGPFTSLAQTATKDIFSVGKKFRRKRLDRERDQFGEVLGKSGVLTEGVNKQFEGLTAGKGAKVTDVFKPSGLAKGLGVSEVAKQTGAGVASAVLGPFAPLAQVLGKDVFKLFKSIKGRVAKPSLKGLGIRDSLGQVFKEDIKKEGKVRRSGLFNFFDKDAFKDKWTKEVLNLLRKGFGEEKGDGGGFLSSLLGFLGITKGLKLFKGVLGKLTTRLGLLVGGTGAISFLSKALFRFGGILAVVGTAIAGFKIGTFLSKKFVEKPVDDFFTKREQKILKEQFGPVTKKEIEEFTQQQLARRGSVSVSESSFKKGEEQRRKEIFLTPTEEDNEFRFSVGNREVLSNVVKSIGEKTSFKSVVGTNKKLDLNLNTEGKPLSEELKDGFSKIATDLQKGLKQISENLKPGIGSSITAVGKSAPDGSRDFDDEVLNMFNTAQISIP